MKIRFVPSKFLDYLCSDEGQILYHWGIEGENYFLDDDGQPYRTDEEVAKAQSDPDYAKNTGIDNYTGFPIYGTGSYSEDGFPYTPTTKESVIANYNTAEKEGCEAMGFEMLTDMFCTAGRVRSSSILCTVGISAATGTC